MNAEKKRTGRPRIHADDAARRLAWRRANPDKVRKQNQEAKKRQRLRKQRNEAMETPAEESAANNGDPG